MKSVTTGSVLHLTALDGNVVTMLPVGCVASVRPVRHVWMESAATIPARAYVAAVGRRASLVSAVSGTVYRRAISAGATAAVALAVNALPPKSASRGTVAPLHAETRAVH